MDKKRRQIVAGLSAAATLGPVAVTRSAAQAHKGPIVFTASHPYTGAFSFAGVAASQAMADFVRWKNAQGGIMKREIRYVWEDSGFKLDQGVAVFKKLLAAEKPHFHFGDSTQWAKAVARDAIESNSMLVSCPSLAATVADPVNMPHHFAPGPTYPRLQELLMEYIARSSRGSSEKPRIAYVYSDTEFGKDGIPAGKARAEKLGLPIVAEIVTKQTGVDVGPEVAKLRRARPDIVIFQGYIAAPMPEFVRQLREAGLNPQIMGAAWGLDRPAYEAIGALGARLTGISMYRYGHETDAAMVKVIREQIALTRPDAAHVSPFYFAAWLACMVFSEVAERCIKVNKPLQLQHMKAALESITAFDTGGIVGLLADVSTHQIPVGRLYSYDLDKKVMEPASAWIKV